MLFLVVLALQIVAAATACGNTSSSTWPSTTDWESLSDSLGAGILLKIADVATVYDECAAGYNTGYGSTVLNKYANGTCSFGVVCVYDGCDNSSDAYLPMYSVNATTVAHVETAVQFANTHGVCVSVKSTGADYSLANMKPNSLLIWMSNFPKYSVDGVDESFTDSCGTAYDAVLRIGGGEAFGNVFAALADDGRYMLSSGAAVPVGASGGWLQGGGLGPFDRSLGLGIDNVVQYEVVLPSGTSATVDACSETDLFWALRGGGGGNWGVVVAQTSKVHAISSLTRVYIGWFGAPIFAGYAAYPEGTALAFENKFTGATDVGWNVSYESGPGSGSSSTTVSLWHEAMAGLMNPGTMDNRLDGYYSIGCNWLNFICADLYFRGTAAEFEATFLADLRPLLNMTYVGNNSGGGNSFFYMYGEFSSYYDYASSDCTSAVSGSAEDYICNTLGYPSANGYTTDVSLDQGSFRSQLSWIVPASVVGGSQWTELCLEDKFWYASGHIIGGATNDVETDATAVNPYMRSGAMEFLLLPVMDPDSTSMANIRSLIDKYFPGNITSPVFNHDALNLDVITPLADTYGLTWAELYWGSNLERLQEIKYAYDPDGIFSCRDCVNGTGQQETSSSRTTTFGTCTALGLLYFLVGV
eukprot:NODE_63_length_2289_cov_344.195613.p1 GENE.NODE_63_length_2289_cov_344.195613~~NODE_63_length_2289_cov_344.195613.p1  ORF type:complete len:642 (-),score=135.52 NODE_63_length_2289_cov_344.195613:278-2203(-)